MAPLSISTVTRFLTKSRKAPKRAGSTSSTSASGATAAASASLSGLETIPASGTGTAAESIYVERTSLAGTPESLRAASGTIQQSEGDKEKEREIGNEKEVQGQKDETVPSQALEEMTEATPRRSLTLQQTAASTSSEIVVVEEAVLPPSVIPSAALISTTEVPKIVEAISMTPVQSSDRPTSQAVNKETTLAPTLPMVEATPSNMSTSLSPLDFFEATDRDDDYSPTQEQVDSANKRGSVGTSDSSGTEKSYTMIDGPQRPSNPEPASAGGSAGAGPTDGSGWTKLEPARNSARSVIVQMTPIPTTVVVEDDSDASDGAYEDEDAGYEDGEEEVFTMDPKIRFPMPPPTLPTPPSYAPPPPMNVSDAPASPITQRLTELEEELRTALNVLDNKSTIIDHLVSELGQAREDLHAVERSREEEARLRRRLENDRLVILQNFETERNEARVARERQAAEMAELAQEVERLKGLLANERRESQERATAVVQEKEELVSKLEAQQDRISNLIDRVEAQQERIGGLEVRLEDSREETKELVAKHNEMEAKLAGNTDERELLAVKEGHIVMLEMNAENMAAQVVQLQTRIVETERQNMMLMDQLRSQSDQMQCRLNDSTHRFSNATQTSLGSSAQGLRRGGACSSRAQGAMKALQLLNDEIFQVAASLTDQLEGINKRFVSGDAPRLAKAEYLKSIVGLELVRRLERDAPFPIEDVNPFYVQAALQGCLTACCMRIITSWYPAEWEYGSFLEALYERIRGTNEIDGVENALTWRKTTQQNCVPAVPRTRNSKLVDFIIEELQTVVSVSGWSKQSGGLEVAEKLREKLFNVVAMAIRLNSLTAMGVPGEMEPVIAERGNLFDPKRMVDDCSRERGETSVTANQSSIVICAMGLGLRWANGSEVDSPHLLVKPTALLENALW